MIDKATPALFNIAPSQYPELKTGPFTLYRRLLVLTKNGTQECTYTNEQGAKELDTVARSIERYFKTLKDLNYISVERRTNTFGTNVRIITVNTDKFTHSSASKGAVKSSEVASQKDPKKVADNQGDFYTTNTTKYPTKFPTIVGCAPDKAPDNVADKLSGAKEAITLIYIGVDMPSPYLILEDNIERMKIRAAGALERAPQLLTCLTKFNLQCLKQYLPRELTPFGQPHDFTFDFTEPYETYAYTNVEQLRNMPPEFWRAGRPELDRYWRDLFIMTALVELTCYTNQNFTCVDKCDQFGKDFDKYYFRHRYGFQHLLINAVYATDETQYDGYSIFKSIRNGFMGGGNRHILNYARAVIINEVINILNNPVSCEQAFLAWRRAFYAYAKGTRIAYSPGDSTRLEYYSMYLCPNLGRRMLCDEFGFAPRLFMPVLLFRRICVLERHATRQEYGGMKADSAHAAKLITDIHNSPIFQQIFAHFADKLGDVFAFLRADGVIDHV